MRLRGIGFFAVFVFVLNIAGCSNAHLKPFKVGANHWIGFEPLHLAQENGFYQQHKIKIIELSSSSQTAKALEQGLIDAGALTLDEAIRLASRSDQYSIVTIFDYSNGGDAIIAQDNVSEMAQLVGRKIGLEEGTVSKYMFFRATQLANLNPADFTIVPVHFNQHQEAFLSKKVDAVVTFEPVKTILLKTGANKLMCSTLIPKEIVDVLVVKKDKEAAFKKQIKALLEGWALAVNLLKNNDADGISLLAQRTGLSPDDVRHMLSKIDIPVKPEIYDMLYSTMPRISPQIETMTKFLHEVGVLDNSIAPDLLPTVMHLNPGDKTASVSDPLE